MSSLGFKRGLNTSVEAEERHSSPKELIVNKPFPELSGVPLRNQSKVVMQWLKDEERVTSADDDVRRRWLQEIKDAIETDVNRIVAMVRPGRYQEMRSEQGMYLQEAQKFGPIFLPIYLVKKEGPIPPPPQEAPEERDGGGCLVA